MVELTITKSRICVKEENGTPNSSVARASKLEKAIKTNSNGSQVLIYIYIMGIHILYVSQCGGVSRNKALSFSSLVADLRFFAAFLMYCN